MSTSNIAWTDATWNPVTGCTKVSPGCAHCYAEALSKRFGRSFDVTLHPERLDEPLHWRKPRRVFVCSMADLFHEQVPWAFVDAVFGIMARAHQHTFQVLTKRPERMAILFDRLAVIAAPGMQEPWALSEKRRYHLDIAAQALVSGMPLRWAGSQWPIPNVWLGVSIENDHYAYRADILRQTPAAVRFISAEPLLGPLPSLDLTGIDWLIIGGESGPGHRRMDPQWALDLIVAARAAGTKVFVKQGSGPRPGMQGDLPDWAFALREYPR
jgi:protein gp37